VWFLVFWVHNGGKLPVFILADRGTGQRYVIPAKAAAESTLQFLLADRQEVPITVYTNGFRVDDPLNEDDTFDRKYSSTAMANTLSAN
jgi:transposase-like protein